MSATTELPAYVALRGGSPERVMRAAGVVPLQIAASEQWLPLDRMAALYEAAAAELDNPHFGLAFGESQQLEAFGLLYYVVRNAATVRTALNNLARYSSSLSISGVAVDFYVAARAARLDFTVPGADRDASRQLFESVGATLCNLMRMLNGPEWRPREVCFEHAPAGSPAESSRLLQATVRYHSDRHSIAFDASCLNEVVPGADRSLLPVIEKRVHDVIASGENDPLLGSVRRELARTLCDGKPDIRGVARRLAMSPRTLQRRLHATGATFKAVVTQTRTELAKEYLADGGASMTEIAFLLGYSELSAFDHAFRRATGKSPTQWRRESAGSNGRVA